MEEEHLGGQSSYDWLQDILRMEEARRLCSRLEFRSPCICLHLGALWIFLHYLTCLSVGHTPWTCSPPPPSVCVYTCICKYVYLYMYYCVQRKRKVSF